MRVVLLLASWFLVFFLKQMPSVKDGTTQGKNIPKKDPITLRSVLTPKVKMVQSVSTLKRGCENKTISTIKTPSHKEVLLSSSSGKRIFHWNITTNLNFKKLVIVLNVLSDTTFRVVQSCISVLNTILSKL